MKRASDWFSEEERARVAQAVAEAEQLTSAEVVPVVATASGRYDRAEDLIGLWVGIACMALVWWLFPRDPVVGAMWGPGWAALELPALIIAVITGFALGALIGTYVHVLRYLFTPKQEMAEEVLHRAQQAFHDQRVHRTAGATGLVLYISLYERMAAVVGDDVVVEKLGQGTIDELCGQLIEGLRNGPPVEALCAALAQAAKALVPVLPRAEDDVNELPNTICFLD